MTPTREEIAQRYDELNARYFDGQLPRVPIRLSRARSYLGQLRYKRRRKLLGGTENYGFVLFISIRTEQTADELADTLLHEMIHLYIASRQLKDTSTHGRLFRQLMDELNRRYGRHISISHRRTQQELDADRQLRTHVVCVTSMNTGERGVTVAAHSRVALLRRHIPRLPGVVGTEWLISHDPYFNRFPRSLTPKVYRAKPAELAEHLKTARPLPAT